MTFARALTVSVTMILATAAVRAGDEPESIPKATAKPDKIAMPAKVPPTWLTYHLAHPGPGGTYPADPNCGFFWKGQYHLHYIFQRGPNNHCWAHVTSPDMVHWKWQPTPLTTDNTGHGMFSGGSFLTKEGRPAIIYHGLGSGFNQIAIALDDKLEKWTKPYPMMGVTKEGQKSKVKYWDPDCWLDGDTYYAISGGGPPSLFKSTDLKKWTEIGPLMHDNTPTNLGFKKNDDVSCPNMFKLGNKWMLTCISHGSGARYYLGTFKDEQFLPDFHGKMNFRGKDVFAPTTIQTPDGRRVMWAWLQIGGKFQGGVQCLPRELSLPDDGVLRIKPLKELESLREDPKEIGAVALKGGAPSVLDGVSGDALELSATIKAESAKSFGARVLCDADGQGGMAIKYEPQTKSLYLESFRDDPKKKSPIPDTVKAPLDLPAGEPLKLRIFVDKALVEVFANDRQAVLAVCPAPKGLNVSLWSEGGDAAAQGVQVWKLKSAY